MLKLVSSDSHVAEPPDLWTRALGDRFGARVPHLGKNAGSGMYGDWTGRLQGDWFVVEGMPAFPMVFGSLGGVHGPERGRRLGEFDFYKDARKSAYLPETRLADMDADGVSAEVIYSSYMARFLHTRDAELQRECAKVFNDYLAEYVSHAPDRLLGVACISLVDARLGAVELERALKRGLRGAAIWCAPPPELSFASSHYDPFWAAAEAANVPVSLHALPPLDTAGVYPRAKSAFVENKTMGVIEDFHIPNVLFNQHIQRSLIQITLSGVFERFPKLRLIVCEWGTEWIPALFDGLDWSAGNRPDGLPLKRKPSEYLREHVWYTFDRSIGLAPDKLDMLKDRLMWSSDFPHVESSWPESRSTFETMAKGLDDGLRAKLAHGNVHALYDFG